MKPGDTWTVIQYLTAAATGTPTGLLYHNGVVDAASVTVAQIGSTAGYTVSVVIPSSGSYVEDVIIELTMTAVVAGVTQTQVVSRNEIHLLNPADVAAAVPGAILAAADLMALLSRGHLTTSGVTVPATADPEWSIPGLYIATTGTLAANPYFFAKTLHSYAWTDGTFFFITSTAPGVTLPSAYFKTASGVGVTGPYALVGTGSGTPTVAYHGNAILNTVQPNINPATNAQAVAILADLVSLLAVTPATTGQASTIITGVAAILAGVNVTEWGGANVTGMPLPTNSYTAAPTAAQVATAILTDLLASGDFSTVASLGALFRSLGAMISGNAFTAPALAAAPGSSDASGETGTVVGTPTVSGGSTTFDCTGLEGPPANYLVMPTVVFWQTGPNGGKFPITNSIATPGQAGQIRLTIASPGNLPVAGNQFILV